MIFSYQSVFLFFFCTENCDFFGVFFFTSYLGAVSERPWLTGQDRNARTYFIPLKFAREIVVRRPPRVDLFLFFFAILARRPYESSSYVL